MATLRRIARTSGFRHFTGALRIIFATAADARRMQAEMSQRFPGARFTD